MPGWGLRLAAFCATLAMFAGSLGYAATHVKNATAPLQPPVAGGPPAASAAPQPTPSPLPPLLTLRGPRAQATGTPGPRLTIAPGVRSASLAPLTFTHVS